MLFSFVRSRCRTLPLCHWTHQWPGDTPSNRRCPVHGEWTGRRTLNRSGVEFACLQLVTDSVLLTQGAVVLLGKTNMFRFNHPQQAAKLRTEMQNVIHCDVLYCRNCCDVEHFGSLASVVIATVHGGPGKVDREHIALHLRLGNGAEAPRAVGGAGSQKVLLHNCSNLFITRVWRRHVSMYII